MRFDPLKEPGSDYLILALVAGALAVDYFITGTTWLLIGASAVGSLPVLWETAKAARRLKISIDTFNAFAVIVSFVFLEFRSAAFICLMLASARLLEFYTEAKARRAIEELLKLKPAKATIEEGGSLRELPVDDVKTGDVLLVKNGERVPVDGIIIYGEAHINEAPVTGESLPVKKVVGDEVLGLTFAESGVIKVRATRVGKESTIERMVALITEASKHKTRTERLADRFAAYFLPIVIMLGALTLAFTRDYTKVAALFLVACADDMAVAIPMAVTATLRRAAQMGVVIKGGRWLDALIKARIIVFDKTGTLTYGSLSIQDVQIEPGVGEADFWRSLAAAEKFSEHPIGRAVFRRALEHCPDPPDADEYQVVKGAGVTVRIGPDRVSVGNEKILDAAGAADAGAVRRKLEQARQADGGSTVFVVIINGAYAGRITVADTPRREAAESIAALKRLGIERVIMFTGDSEAVAANVARTIGISEVRASMTPEDKLRQLEKLLPEGPVIMVGDGINDAPALAVAHVGIAMGGGGTAVAVEAADAVILTDNLDRLPQLIRLVRLTRGVVNRDIVIWAASNVIGFALVLTGIAGPALAAFYNFVTDFLPLLNSLVLFRRWRPAGEGDRPANR